MQRGAVRGLLKGLAFVARLFCYGRFLVEFVENSWIPFRWNSTGSTLCCVMDWVISHQSQRKGLLVLIFKWMNHWGDTHSELDDWTVSGNEGCGNWKSLKVCCCNWFANGWFGKVWLDETGYCIAYETVTVERPDAWAVRLTNVRDADSILTTRLT